METLIEIIINFVVVCIFYYILKAPMYVAVISVLILDRLTSIEEKLK